MTTAPLVSVSDFQQPERTVRLPIDADREPLTVTFRPPELTTDFVERVTATTVLDVAACALSRNQRGPRCS